MVFQRQCSIRRCDATGQRSRLGARHVGSPGYALAYGGAIVLVGLVLAIPCPSCAQERAASEKVARPTDWLHWRGPDHNGISKETGWNPKSGMKVLWRAKVGTGYSSFSISKGRAYTMGNTDNKDTVFCFDAENGKVLWSHTYACPLDPKNHDGGPNATPTVDGGNVYTLSKRGHLFCLDAATGKVKWSKTFRSARPTWGYASSVLVLDRMLILNVGKAGVALDKTKQGRMIWNNGTGKSGYSTAVPYKVAGRQCIAIAAEVSFMGLLASNGQKLWEYPWKTRYEVNAADPIIHGDKVFISSGYGRGCALVQVGRGQPNRIWEHREMRNHFNSCVLVKGALYGFDEKKMKCLDFQTGRVRWTQGGLGKGSLMSADGKLIIMSENGRLVIAEASPTAYKELASKEIFTGRTRCWTTPILSGGRIYCRQTRSGGPVACVDVKGE